MNEGEVKESQDGLAKTLIERGTKKEARAARKKH
jgi:hypothetical protein